MSEPHCCAHTYIRPSLEGSLRVWHSDFPPFSPTHTHACTHTYTHPHTHIETTTLFFILQVNNQQHKQLTFRRKWDKHQPGKAPPWSECIMLLTSPLPLKKMYAQGGFAETHTEKLSNRVYYHRFLFLFFCCCCFLHLGVGTKSHNCHDYIATSRGTWSIYKIWFKLWQCWGCKKGPV